MILKMLSLILPGKQENNVSLSFSAVGIEALGVKSMLIIKETNHEISNNVVCETSKASDQPAYSQSDQSLC